jgi:hypothetical protein
MFDTGQALHISAPGDISRNAHYLGAQNPRLAFGFS